MRTILITLALALLIAGGVVAEDIPALPESFYGTVSLNGNPAPAGTIISAMVNGAELGRITTSTPGYYAWDGKTSGPDPFIPKLDVTGPGLNAGTAITFLVNGVQAAETASYSPGEAFRLDLTASGTGTIPPTTIPPTQSPVSSSGSSYQESSSSSASPGESSGFATGNAALQGSATPPPTGTALPVTSAAGESTVKTPGMLGIQPAGTTAGELASPAPTELPGGSETTKAGSLPAVTLLCAGCAGAVALFIQKNRN